MKNYTFAGRAIAGIAIKQNMTVKDLAENCGISYSHMSNMLRGVKSIDEKTVRKIGDALELNRADRNALREAVFVSNPKVIIETNGTESYILRFIYMVLKKKNSLSKEQIRKCWDIIEDR